MAIQTIKFSKKWLLSLRDTPPAARTEFKDQDYKYLRARATPKGHVSLSVIKVPRGGQTTRRRTLNVLVDKFMPDMADVRALAAEAVRKIDAGEPTKSDKVVLQDALDLLLTQADIRERTKIEYQRNVEKHLKDWLKKPMTGEAQKIINKHRAIAREAGPVAANNVMRTYRRVMNIARANDKDVPPWPAEKLRTLKLWSKETTRTRRLNRSEFPEYWEAIDDLSPLWRDLWRFYLLTGCRRREATGLKVGDVNLREKTVTFRKTKNGTDHTLPLTSTLLEIIKRRVKAAGDDGLLFPCPEPREITDALEFATGVHLSVHDCRRTFAGVAEAAGVGSHTIGLLTNHRSTTGTVTGGYIGDLDDTDLRDALDRIETKYLALAASVPGAKQ